jgi:hypothetical protein
MNNPRKRPGRPRIRNSATAAQRMQASRTRKREAGLRLVQSWVPDAPVIYSDHMRLDARSLAIHSAVARKLIADPGLVAKARATLGRWKGLASGPLPTYFADWDRLLERPPEEIAGFLVSMTAEAVRLRQSSPFAPLLSPEERAKIYAAFQ